MLKESYSDFLKYKIKRHGFCGIKTDNIVLNEKLKPFQGHIVKIALKKGVFAIFADCGLGKTFMQLEWARIISEFENMPVLILCPLSVVEQTIDEGLKFGISAKKFNGTYEPGIHVINYEQIDNIDCSKFIAVVLDESSILKSFTGVYRNKLTDNFCNTKYRLCCTATPSPNDLNEIGNHSDFLGVLDAEDMRSKWFVRDEGMNNYRLKGHAKKDFYGWISSWSIFISKPSDIGFDDTGYILPKLNIIEHVIETKKIDNGKLFNDIAINATNYNGELRRTFDERLDEAVNIVNKIDGQVIVWIKQNVEEEIIERIESSCVLTGAQSDEKKSQIIRDFKDGKFRVLITKTKIAQFGLNFQNCHNQVFVAPDFSFEGLYQSIRRSWRFGQLNQVNIYVLITDTMEGVLNAIISKRSMFEELRNGVIEAMAKEYFLNSTVNRREVKTNEYTLVNNDSCDEWTKLPDNSIDFMVFSPPFSSLFTYSNLYQDIGNSDDDKQFFDHYMYLLPELYRTLKNGRLIAVHTKDIAKYKNSSGYTGLYNFTRDHDYAMEKVGFKYHSKITIWTDPVLEMQRTKTQRLLYKQVTSDSTYSGIGVPEYVTIYRKWEGNEDEWEPVNFLNKNNFPLDTWQKWASPVWMDIRRTDVLNGKEGVDQGDEKHICPLQLDVIKRLICLYTNEGDLVATPFGGIGSEPYKAIELKRRAFACELKPSYFDTMVKNCAVAYQNSMQINFFDEIIN